MNTTRAMGRRCRRLNRATGSSVGLGEQVIPRTPQGLFQTDYGIHGWIFRPGFDFLNVASAQIGFLGQALLGVFGHCPKSAYILSKSDMRGPIHLMDDAL